MQGGWGRPTRQQQQEAAFLADTHIPEGALRGNTQRGPSAAGAAAPSPHERAAAAADKATAELLAAGVLKPRPKAQVGCLLAVVGRAGTAAPLRAAHLQ